MLSFYAPQKLDGVMNLRFELLQFWIDGMPFRFSNAPAMLRCNIFGLFDLIYKSFLMIYSLIVTPFIMELLNSREDLKVRQDCLLSIFTGLIVTMLLWR